MAHKSEWNGLVCEFNLLIFVMQTIFIICSISMRQLPKFSIFRPPSKYKRFNYVPQFYDAEQEEREKKRKQLQADETMLPSDFEGKRINLRAASKFTKDYKEARRKSNIRLMIILGILIMGAYYLYRTNFIEF